jgi:hypothetical protein
VTHTQAILMQLQTGKITLAQAERVLRRRPTPRSSAKPAMRAQWQPTPITGWWKPIPDAPRGRPVSRIVSRGEILSAVADDRVTVPMAASLL